MAKQLNVNLAFTANTSQAKTQIMELQKVLQQLGTGTNISGIAPEKIKQAATAAKELSYHLNQAYNSDTGNIDLSRLNASLSKSKTNVNALSSSLLQVGTNGQQAFIKLAQAISMADRPIVRTNGLLKELWVTMQNTMRWQLTSSVLHGFMGAVQKAYGYTQDLNESLNNIRIVTNNSVEQMAQFAEQANKAAKALNTTTTAYTDASLIYYQQGLTPEEVQKRTEVTIKMANAAGQSAETVSDQLTAVWNNFAKGGENLEYYADVMTALGAATASSTDEISEGLNKFASVAETVGLSYEYAAASLATVTATTRQSADVVGNAFKTLFARIQGLQLGETLDDGTTLNKYSKALDAVGINIKDTNGEIKQMDTILNELGAKWNTLGKDQQIALAQTVAGVRQYTQLIALMDNWDFFQDNLEVAYDSEGTLQKQADIYAESWEAARDRVQASAESIYSSIFDDKVFIKLTDFTGELIDSIDAVIDGIGGLKGVALIIGTVFTNLLSKKITPMVQNLGQNLAIIIQGAGTVASKVSNQMNAKIQSELDNNKTTGKYNTTQITQLTNAKDLTTARTKLMMVSDSLNEKERQLYQSEIDIIQLQQEESVAIAQKIDSLKLEEQQLLKNIEISGRRKTNFNDQKNSMVNSYTNFDDAEYIENQFDRVEIAANEAAQKIAEFYAKAKQNANESKSLNLSEPYEQLKAVLNDLKLSIGTGNGLQPQEFKNILISVEQLLPAFKSLGGASAKAGVEIQKIFNELKTGQRKSFGKAFDEIFQKLEQVTLTGEEAEQVLRRLSGVGFQKLSANLKESSEASKRLEESQRQLNAAIESFNPTHVVSGLQAITSMASGLGSVAMGLNAIKSIWTTWSNPDLSGFEKVTATLMSISMLAPSITSAFNMIKTTAQTSAMAAWGESIALNSVNKGSYEYVLLSGLKSKASAKEQILALRKVILYGNETGAIKENVKVSTLKYIRDKLEAGVTLEVALAEAVKAGKIKESTQAEILETYAIEAKTAANYKLMSSMIAVSGIMLVVAAAIAAIVIGYKAMKANSPEGQLKAAEKNTEALSQAAEEAKTNFENLLNTIDSYENAKAAIEDMTSSTEGFRDKIQEANQAARDLIETYGIASGYSIDDNGMIVFDDGVIEAAEQQEAKKAAEANFMAAGAQTYENQMALDVVKDQVLADFSENAISASYEELKTYTDNLFEFAKNSSNSAESLFGGVNKNFTVQEAFNDESFANLAKNVLGREDATSDNLTTDEFAVISKLIQNSNQYIDDLNNYQKQIVPNDNYKIALATEAVQYDSYLDNAFKEQTIDRVIADTITDEAIADKVQELSFTEVMQSYKDKLGATDYKFNVATRSYSFTDEEGNEVGSGISYDSMANSVATSLLLNDAFGEIDEDSQEINNLTSQLKSTYGDQSNALIAAINGDMSSISEEMMGDWADFGFGDFINLKGFPELVSLLGENLTEIVSQLVNWKPEDYVPPTLQEQYNQIQTDKKAIEGLEYGEALEDGIYETLSDTTKQYFQLMSDGMYHLVGDAEQLQETLDQQEESNLINQATQTSRLAGDISTGYSSNDITTWAEQAIQGNRDFVESDYQRDIAEAVGMLDEYNAALSGTEEEQKQFVANMGAAWLQMNTDAEAAKNTLLMNADSIDDLNEYLAKGIITGEEYNKNLARMQELEGQENGLDSEEIQERAEAIQDIATSSEAFADTLKDDKEAAEEVAREILRYQRAIDKVSNSYEDWEDAIDEGTLQDQPELFEEIREAYGDLLDLDGDKLSDTFLTNADNLDLMKEAAEGNVDAYNQLQSIAAQDIFGSIGEVTDEIANAITEIANIDSVDVGEKIIVGKNDVANKLNDLYMNAYNAAIEGGHNVAEAMAIANDIINAVGYNPPEIEMEEKTVYVQGQLPPDKIPSAGASFTSDDLTAQGVTWRSEPGDGYEYPITMLVPKATSFTKSAETIGGGGKKSSGGGGGGSKKKDKKKYSDEIERYHEINEVIEDLTADLDALSEAKDRAFGADKLALMDQEIAKQKELMAAQEQYLAEIEDYYASDKAAIAAYGAIFDEEGRITNYDEIMKQQIDKFNRSRTEEAEEAYNEFIEILEQYEETNNLYQEQEQELINQRYELLDMQLEVIQEEVNLRKDLAEDSLSLIEHALNAIEDLTFNTAESIGLLGQQVKYLQDQIAADMTGITKIMSDIGMSDADISNFLNGSMSYEDMSKYDFTADQIDTLREYRDNLLETNEELLDLRKTIMDEVLEAFEEWNDALDSQIDKFDHYNDVIDNFKNIIELIGADMLGFSDELLNAFDETAITNAVNKLAASKDKMDALRQSELNAQRELEEARIRGNERDIQFWQQTLEEIEEQTNDAEEEMLSAWEEGLEAAGDLFEQQVEKAIATYEEALSGTFGTLDALQEAFDQQSEISERYLADYQKIYELTKLNRNIVNSIDETDNIKAKKELRELQEEINELQESDTKLSQYDLDYLQKKYELKLAEIALEEAQNAKSQVRMSRDSEGNWSYVYTADQDKVDQAYQNYEDKLYEMQELNSEYIKEVQNGILQSEIELANALRDLDRAKFKSDEEYYAEVARITEYYTGQRNYYLDENSKALSRNKELFNEDWKEYSEATGYKRSADKDYVDSFNETILAQLAGYETIEDAQNEFSKATEIMVKDLNTAFSNWSEIVNRMMAAADTSMSTFATDLVGVIYGDGSEENPGLINASNAAADSVHNMSESMVADFNTVAEAATSWQEKYSDNMDRIIERNQQAAKSVTDMIGAQIGYTVESNTSVTPTTIHTTSAPKAYKTGGLVDYTGLAWLDGSPGRPELVLNSDDTEKLLHSVEIVRHIAKEIELNAMSQALGLGVLRAATASNHNQILEQDITIHAEFPNATDHNEIELAFQDLANMASQFANRKNK